MLASSSRTSTNHQITTATAAGGVCIRMLLMLPPFFTCRTSQKLKPEWSKAATTLNEHDATIIIGKVGTHLAHSP
jgi:hypothetical protein